MSTRAHEEPLPVPTASDVALARAQAQYERGHLRDALLALDAIGPGDPLSGEADQLKAIIQSKLLEAARMPPPETKVATPPFADEMPEMSVHQLRQRRPLPELRV